MCTECESSTANTSEPTTTWILGGDEMDPAIYPEERFDDEANEEWDNRLLTANMKEGYDVFRGDDRVVARTLFSEYTRAVRRSEAREDELKALFLAQLSNHQQVTNRDQLQSTAHRDIAIAQQWRDQARDSGESVFKPEQSA